VTGVTPSAAQSPGSFGKSTWADWEHGLDDLVDDQPPNAEVDDATTRHDVAEEVAAEGDAAAGEVNVTV
jgi:hypothetical protein